MKTTTVFLFLISTIALSLTACKGKEEVAQKPVQPYNVIALKTQDAELYAEYPTTLQGMEDIEIRPMINGYIDHIYVDEGQEVKKGDLLFKISNPQFAQDVSMYAARVESAKTAVEAAKIQVEKTKPLVEQNIISTYELTNANLALDMRKAELEQAKATYANAQTNLGYTLVKSPVAGVVGKLPYKLGSYVYSNTTLPLTTVSNISKVYAYFSINEKEQLKIFETIDGKTFQEKIAKIPAVSLVLSNGEMYEQQGKIETFSGLINTQTGSFNVRAGFENPTKMLRSGSSAAIRIPTHLTNVIIIPQKATAELQDKRMAYIVGEENKVTGVPIKVIEIPGGKYFVVTEGLKPNDQLIVEGIGIVPEGAVIKPQIIPADSVLKF
ncbi:MAG TPA: efflux RND transporter periplasmic adaptor subunit [Crocinitomicaceae bacterium]|nr:efflux RND transporter periplasmic adaptor subunit [Crocinitomicaceae bacterium]